MSGLFRCPICSGALARVGGSLKCGENHTFDVASSGYVSLLTGSHRGAVTGDSKEMCASRNRFLSGGYYACLARGLSSLLAERLSGPSPALVDAACGEGYYTTAMHDALAHGGREPLVAGVDLSKHALKYAAKRCPSAKFAVASIFSMPLPDAFADAVTNVFAPVAAAEFLRVTKPGGLLIIVGPTARHLWGLKEFLYEKPYANEPNTYELPGFAPLETRVLEDTICLRTGLDVMDLFAMTPYFWKTPREAVERLRTLDTLETEIGFELHIFQKQR